MDVCEAAAAPGRLVEDVVWVVETDDEVAVLGDEVDDGLASVV